MTGRSSTERILDAYLAPEPDRLADRVIDAALDQIARTPQRRALRVPWRFPLMPALSRATGIAAVVLVAVVGAGGLVYLSSNVPGSGSGSTPAPTDGPTTAATPQPSFPGIAGWKTYTSEVYGYTISYPEDWSVDRPATRKWQPGEPEDGPWSDIFFNQPAVDGDGIGMFALQITAPDGADLASWDGLLAALKEMCARPTEFAFEACPRDDPLVRLCLGTQDCRAVLLARATDEEASPRALFGDPDTGIVTFISIGRPDDFPAAARYGGTVMLLKAILSQLGVRDPLPGETPS